MEDPNQTQNENPKKHLEILAKSSHLKAKFIRSIDVMDVLTVKSREFQN